ncbi:MAG: sugar phosphate isomerase/epimerase [Verrucomicrobiota bacterium]|nr:sugar phosphate isomerase/epimerase [Verrucomicrobiota bacterium]
MNAFRYCLNGSTIRTTPILEKIRVAASAGFEGIELWHDDIDNFLQEGGSLSTIKEALCDHGLSVPTTIYLDQWFNANDLAWPSILKECKRRMEQAAAIQASHIIAAPPSGKANIHLGSQRYRELLELGESINVLPSIEFLGFVEQINTIEAALDVINKSGHPKGTTILDPFHIHRGNGSLESITKLEGHQVAIAHFMDTLNEPPRNQQFDKHRTMPGDGSFDLKRYLILLGKIGFKGWVSLELFREDLWTRNPEKVAIEGLTKMKSLIES